MSDNHHNVGKGASSTYCCSNCTVEFNTSDIKSNKFKWFDRQKCDEKDVGIVEAIVVVFEGLLHMNGKQISPTESLSMCRTCIDNISELYRIYREFMERSVAGSFFRELFPLCMLYPSTKTEIKKSVVAVNRKSKELSKGELYSVQSVEKIEEINPVKVELPYVGKFENEVEENDWDMDLSFDNEHCDSENESLISIPKLKNNELAKYSDQKLRHEELPQLLNGEWILPKVVKIVLTKYIPGDPKTLDIVKSRKLRSKTVKSVDKNLSVKKTCSICSEVFTNIKKYYNHRRKHKEDKESRRYSCKYCGRNFKNNNKLSSHEIAVHTTERPFKCETCGKTFPLKDRLKTHVKHYHENTIEFRRAIQKRKEESRVAKGLPRNKKGKFVRWELSHPNEIDKVRCDLCQKVFCSPQYKDLHYRAVHLNEKPFVCKFCGRRFITNAFAKFHEQSHLGIKQKKVNCEECGKPYVGKKLLEEHMASVHGVVDECVCEECGKTYATPLRLKLHKRGVHPTKVDEYKCEQCGKILKNRQKYLSHQKTHNDERPFLCTECGMAFKRQRTLDKHHVVIHHQNAAAICQQCEKGFFTISDYEEHMAKGYHLKPKFLRPIPARPRNLNAPCYLKAKIERKLERQLKQLDKDPSASIEIRTELIKEAEEKLKLLKVNTRQKKSSSSADAEFEQNEPIINFNTNYQYGNEYQKECNTQQWEQDPLQ